jgi:hypothetical protein
MEDEEQLNFWDWIAMRHKEEDEKQAKNSKTEDES